MRLLVGVLLASAGWAHSALDAPGSGLCPLEPLCAYDSELCQDYHVLEERTDSLLRSSPWSDAHQVIPLNQKLARLADKTKALIHERRLEEKSIQRDFSGTWCVAWKIERLSAALMPSELTALSEVLKGLEMRAGALETQMDQAKDPRDLAQPFSREIDAINAEGSRLWDHLKEAALNIDRMGRPGARAVDRGHGFATVESPSVKLVAAVNPLQLRVAELGRRLKRLELRLREDYRSPEESAKWGQERKEAIDKIDDPFGRPVVSDNAGGDAMAPVPGFARRDAGLPGPPLTLSQPRPTLLDIAHVPPATKEVPPPPQARYNPGFLSRFLHFMSGGRVGRHKFNRDTKEAERIADLRERDSTRTIGDPGGRASYVFMQTGNTCGIASQVVLCQASGACPSGANAKDLENDWYEKAAREGFFTGTSADKKRRYREGTADQYMGALLPMPVVKRYSATEGELNAVLMKDKMVIVSVDTGILWNIRRLRGKGHIVTVVGAEIDTATGRVLGYYINDTGTNHGGRLVPAGQFLEAWYRLGSSFVEPA